MAASICCGGGRAQFVDKALCLLVKLCIVTYGHELWVATEIILLRVQAVETGFLLRLTVCDKVKR